MIQQALVSQWSAPANIALIKYWGKKGLQLPANPSLSMTLDKSRTYTRVSLDLGKEKGSWEYTYDHKPRPEFDPKISAFFHRIRPELPFLNEVFIRIDSTNNFPHSSGISSSASFYASLALCLCQLNEEYYNRDPRKIDLLKIASNIARLGSGSASRSILPGFSVWGQSFIPQSTDQHAVDINSNIHPVFRSYRDAILIISSDKKPLSSTAGHKLMNENPYAEIRYKEANNNMLRLYQALQDGNQGEMIVITEHEALSLHGLIMSSTGGTLLVKPETIACIEAIREYRKNSGSKSCFTLDAGPNIHLLYPDNEKEPIQRFIKEKLLAYCENDKWIDDSIGQGPQKASILSEG